MDMEYINVYMLTSSTNLCSCSDTCVNVVLSPSLRRPEHNTHSTLALSALQFEHYTMYIHLNKAWNYTCTCNFLNYQLSHWDSSTWWVSWIQETALHCAYHWPELYAPFNILCKAPKKATRIRITARVCTAPSRTGKEYSEILLTATA